LGLDADHAAEGRGRADRAAGVGTEGHVGVAGGDDGGRAARGASGDVSLGDGVLGRAECRGLGGRAHAELVHVGLAGDGRAGVFDALDDRRVERRDVVVEHRRPAGRADALGRDVVLDRDRRAREGAVVGAVDSLRRDVAVVLRAHV